MANSRHPEEMKECIQCWQCRNTFDEDSHTPVLLDCLHSICTQCVERIKFHESIECPNCNFRHKVSENGIIGLQADKRWEIYKRYLRAVSERERISCGNCKTNKNPVALFCKQCSFFLCSECEKVHNVWSDFQKHTTTVIDNLRIDETPLSQFAVFSMCKEHRQQVLKFYCTDEGCSRPICAECCLFQHHSHVYISLDDHVNNLKLKIKESLENLEKRVRNCHQIKTKYESENERLTKLETYLTARIDDEFGKCIKLLQGRREYLKGDIRTSIEEKRSAIQDTIGQCQKFERYGQYLKQYWRTIKQTEDPSCYTEIGPKVLSRLQNLRDDKSAPDPPSFYGFQMNINQIYNAVSEFVKTLGETRAFMISPMYSFIEVPKKVFKNEIIEIFLHLKDDSDKFPHPPRPIDGVAVLVSSFKEERITLKTKWLEDDGRYMVQWTPVTAGQYSVDVLVQERDIMVPTLLISVQENREKIGTQETTNKKTQVQSKELKDIQSPTSDNIGKCHEVQTNIKPASLKQSASNKCEKEVGKITEDSLQQDMMSGEFKESEKEHTIAEKAAKAKKKETMGNNFKLKPLPDIPLRVKSPGNVESWAVERRHIKSVPSLDWLNLSSGSETNGRLVRDETTFDNSVREKGMKRRPYSAIGLLPRRRALEHKPKPWIRRSKTEVFFQSLENLDLDVEDSVSKSYPSAYFDVTTLHRDRCMSADHRVLSNKEMWGTPKQFLSGHHLKNYTGALLNINLDKDTVFYFQFKVKYRIFRNLKASNLICEVAINKRRDIDTSESSFFRNSGWSLQICRCIDCYKVCLFAHCNATYIHKSISEDNAGTSHSCSLGLYVNARQKTIRLVETTKSSLVGVFLNVDIAEEDVVAFGVYNPSRLDVTVTLDS